MKSRVFRTFTLVIALVALISGMSVGAMASGGEVRLSTEINGQYVELYFPAGSEAAIAYNRDVKPLLPKQGDRNGKMSDAAVAAMETWKSKYALSQASGVQSTVGKTTPQAGTRTTLTEDELKAYADTMYELVNNERKKAGLQPLKRSSLLDEAAMIRAAEIQIVDNAGGKPHTRPDGTSYKTLLDEMGIKSNRCGENITRAKQTPQDAINAWMQSNGHRKNILRENYVSIGIGVYQRPDGRINWIQIFELK